MFGNEMLAVEQMKRTAENTRFLVSGLRETSDANKSVTEESSKLQSSGIRPDRSIDAPCLQMPRLFTTHGTVLHADAATGELRHGHVSTSPRNARLILDGARSYIAQVDERAS